MLQYNDNTQDRHLCCYNHGLYNLAKEKYAVGKHKCSQPMKAHKKFCNYVFVATMLQETDTNTLVYQVILPANDLRGAPATSWIAWRWLFDFNLKHILERWTEVLMVYHSGR